MSIGMASTRSVWRVTPRRPAAVVACVWVAGLSTTVLCLSAGDYRLKAAEPAARPALRTTKSKARPAAAPSSLDDALLKDLDNELLEGVNDPPAKEGRPAAAPPDDAETDPPGDEDFAAEDIDGEPEEPLMRIGHEMRAVQRLIEKSAASTKAEQLQRQIVSDLAELIQKLEQQCQNGKSSSDSKPANPEQTASRSQVKQPKSGSSNPNGPANNKPAKESTERLGKNDVQKPDMAAMQGLMKDIWGQLPAHAREQMLQSSPERFLPKYELLIEKYYKRLAEEQKQRP